MRNRLKRIVISLLAASAGTALVVITASSVFGPIISRAQNAVPVNVTEAPISRETKTATSLAPVVKKAAPSVVNIFSSKNVRLRPGMPFQFNPFGGLFGPEDEDEAPNPRHRQPRARKETSLGSGVIVTKDGYIITNNHVVDGADEIKVSFAKDRKERVAKVIGRDPRTDIAVIKIDASDLPAITIADSDKLEVGDTVLAIGNPFGVGQTVTSGIVSATSRGGLGMEVEEDFIQTDASINPGNSGGALVDAEGRLVGIPTSIISRSGGNQGIGFAVPSNLARNVMNQLISNGKVTRGFLGVMPKDLTPELAAKFKAPENKGVLISEVSENSAAEEAGIQVGDVVTDINGKPVIDARTFRLAIAQTAPNSKVELTVLRDGKTKNLKATLKQLAEDRVDNGKSRNNPDKGGSDTLDGVTVDDLSSEARAQFKIPANTKGALVTEVDPDSASYAAGLRPGDVIQEINRKPVRNAKDAVELSEKPSPDHQTLLRIYTHGHSDFMVVDESKK
ncbi:MAG TPA: DegQ family serine endoprotease [Verrucomicrobiae bacterium]|nr:DegQ family serine endoprotease [Verrucomicrobiae bacterium]